MIKLENTEVLGWEAAIRGMRNPMNSWEKSDSIFFSPFATGVGHDINGATYDKNDGDFDYPEWFDWYRFNTNYGMEYFQLGPADHKLITSFDQKTVDLIKKQVGARISGRLNGYHGISNYYFLLDDPTELKTFANELSEKDLRTAYLRSEISRKMKSLEELNSSVRTKKAELEVLQETLKRWNEEPTNESKS